MPVDSRVEIEREGTVLRVAIRGDWSLSDRVPSWRGCLRKAVGGKATFSEIRVDVGEVGAWDSSLLLLLLQVREQAEAEHTAFELERAPGLLRELIEHRRVAGVPPQAPVSRDRLRVFTDLGERVQALYRAGGVWLAFLGECLFGTVRVSRRWRKFRWRDSLLAMQQAGAMALPIVGLISFLVGLILAYQAAIQLREYGAEIFVANLVGLSVVREMGPMMTAVILAGRTGAAFAAQIGNMRMNEEVDALETVGIQPVDFLVLPRLLALVLMMPLLTVYANLLGVFGGYVVAVGTLDIAPSAYWFQSREAIGLNDLGSGLIKSVTFGLVVAVAGCLRGLQSERSSEGVGRAATSAVVTGILLIIILDALFAILFERIGI